MTKRLISAEGYLPLRATQNARDKAVFGQLSSSDWLSVRSGLNGEESKQQLSYKTEDQSSETQRQRLRKANHSQAVDMVACFMRR